ncbi:DUF2884 family protein [Shewanella sp. NIFS-20-20]|uniref:DUF2884 family protein n=1 Tax=Shewanella sp. NIFS-20-20 TaxID=2853806 RepID=UPI001C466F17|nr:DUF2884 family protein [Shewanella sp. NIFS-20-20]MBV7316629.1 YggN family protein [Shewanella sp. NIFS-20-20]
MMKLSHRFTHLPLWLCSLALIAITTQAQASQQCDVDLNYDINMTPQSLTFDQQGKEVYRIDNGQLIIANKPIGLNSSQQASLDQYATALREQVPQVVALAQDAVVLVGDAVSQSLTPLLGEQSAKQFDDLLVSIKDKADTLASKKGDHYHIGANGEQVNNDVEQVIADEISQLVQNAIGGLMISMGGQIMTMEGNSFEEKMTAFGSKMEAVGQQIETRVQESASQLEQRAKDMCQQFEHIKTLQQALWQQVPELADVTKTIN